MRHFLAAAIGALTLAWATSAGAQSALVGDVVSGGRIYEEQCGACHSLDANRVGPAHRGVYGRKAGSAPGFAYSPALKRARIVWREDTLDRWLTDPQGFIRGAAMGFRLSGAQQRADVIAYLKQQSPAATAAARSRK